MTFTKGVSGNPNGAKSQVIRRNNMLREQLSGEAEKLLKTLMKHVNSKDEAVSLAATRDALDRLYGKAMSSLEVSGPDGAPMAVMSSTPLSVEQFMLKFAPKVDEEGK